MPEPTRAPTPGSSVHVAMTKWGDRPHWAFTATYLGVDEHGDWIGLPAGTPMARPGVSIVTQTDQVGLVPGPDAGGGAGWLATFHAPGYHVATYVDMTTVPVWDGSTVRAVDLDLDVIRLATGDVFVDDEDEFDEHRVRYDYPSEVVELARRSCRWVRAAVLDEAAPFDEASSRRWFSVAGSFGPAPRG